MSDFFRWQDEAWVQVDYCAHLIRPWAVEERCWFCRDLATHKAEESDVYGTHPMTAYLCCVHFWGHCDSKPACPKCGHDWPNHEQDVDRWFDGKPGVYCLANMGMGDPCGCEERRPRYDLENLG